MSDRLRQHLERSIPPLVGVGRGERGEVPGWLLVIVMTAGLVTVLWAVAGARLESLLSQALDSVTGLSL